MLWSAIRRPHGPASRSASRLSCDEAETIQCSGSGRGRDSVAAEMAGPYGYPPPTAAPAYPPYVFPNPGAPLGPPIYSDKSRSAAFLLAYFLGIFGADRF